LANNLGNQEKRAEDILRNTDCEFTDCKKAIEPVDKKQKELECILDSAPTIIFYKDTEGRFILANRAFGKALNVSKEQLIGKTVFDIYSAKIAQSMRNDDLEVMKSKNPKVDIVEPYESPTGLRWIRTSKIPRFDEKGEVIGLIGFSEEITERKKAKDALKESEEKYRQLVDKMPNMLFEVNANEKLVFANLRAIEILGYSKEELEDFDAHRLVAEHDVERSKNNMKKLFSERIRNSEEYLFKKKNGATLPVLLTSVPIIREGQIMGARGIAVDLTERKELEKRLHEKDRLAAIGATAGMVGHDIRNPLQAIIGDVYLLQEFLTAMPESTTKSDVIESLENIEKNVSYINKIVADLQDYARPLKPDYSYVDLSEIMASIVKNMYVPDNVQVNISSNTFEKIRTEAVFIRRILTNLINNAIQAMPKGGYLELNIESKEDKVFVTVSDTGMGIPEDFKPKLFLPMMTTKAKGQGLGLAVVKRLIEAMDGTVSFESQVGKGTKFIIELPKK
jgi:PAS domain S-box-containing protein